MTAHRRPRGDPPMRDWAEEMRRTVNIVVINRADSESEMRRKRDEVCRCWDIRGRDLGWDFILPFKSHKLWYNFPDWHIRHLWWHSLLLIRSGVVEEHSCSGEASWERLRAFDPALRGETQVQVRSSRNHGLCNFQIPMVWYGVYVIFVPIV
jgi:hypothetical protein